VFYSTHVRNWRRAMTFAIAISIVLLVSTAMLLHQFWTAALDAREDGESITEAFPARPKHPARIDARPPAPPTYRADTAA
jgi:hypothetical protein